MPNEQLSKNQLKQLLGVIGTKRFLRYRKRFDDPCLVNELLSTEPELSVDEARDVVSAGRMIIRQGGGLTALELAKRGEVEAGAGALSELQRRRTMESWAVTLGGVTVIGYVMLALVWSAV